MTLSCSASMSVSPVRSRPMSPKVSLKNVPPTPMAMSVPGSAWIHRFSNSGEARE